jgi:hypothetical protein
MGRRRGANGPSASDDELLEAAMAQAQFERDGMEVEGRSFAFSLG